MKNKIMVLTLILVFGLEMKAQTKNEKISQIEKEITHINQLHLKKLILMNFDSLSLKPKWDIYNKKKR